MSKRQRVEEKTDRFQILYSTVTTLPTELIHLILEYDTHCTLCGLRKGAFFSCPNGCSSCTCKKCIKFWAYTFTPGGCVNCWAQIEALDTRPEDAAVGSVFFDMIKQQYCLKRCGGYSYYINAFDQFSFAEEEKVEVELVALVYCYTWASQFKKLAPKLCRVYATGGKHPLHYPFSL